MYKNEVKHRRAIAECGTGATEAEIKAKYLALGGLYEEEGEEEVEEAETVEVDTAPAEDDKKTPGESEEVAAAEGETVTTDDTSAAPETTAEAPVEAAEPKGKGKGIFGRK